MAVKINEIWKRWAEILAAIVIAMVSFWLIEARFFVTEDEVDKKLATLNFPYSEAEKERLNQALIDRKATDQALLTAIDSNTEAIVDLKVLMAEIRTEMRIRNDAK
jgi:hypothetical protein